MSRPLLAKAAAIVLALPLLAACTTNSQPNDAAKTTPAGSASTEQTQDEFSHEDIMFAEMMIPHHEQAIEMSDLALKNSANERVKLIATKIKAAQGPEIEKMQGWITTSGMGGMHGSGSHSMSGMLSDSQMAALRQAKGPAFDRLFLAGMIEHHQGAIDMAQSATGSSNAEVADLANWIISTQYNEIQEMEAVLARLP